MSNKKTQRRSCKDVFNAFLVRFAKYAGLFEFPVIQPTYETPNKLIKFSKAVSSKDYNQWIHFFEYDYLFERIWKTPKRYLPIIKKFNGVILPDFSLYRDMPFVMQLWNIYRSRAIGSWLQRNGVNVIPNIRYGDKRTYKLCCDGISQHCTIAVGAHGNIKNVKNRKIFLEGLDVIINKLQPSVIVVYGVIPDKYLEKYKHYNFEIIQFDSDNNTSDKKEVK